MGDQTTAAADCQVRRPPYHVLHADIVGQAAVRLGVFTNTTERAKEIAREIADAVLPPAVVAALDALPDADEVTRG